ncbi:glycosyltransferase family 2 protein [Paratractidigestivibacter sp.]|uniref:glycosyltransferase family 2 protein n=1 Tax=Paratractidigestivibacter sp. TaxID=2847316 RepID=UPI002ABDBBBE|nr:glycosyltransferase family 2 protein [Paratractidigestivibacter sp.]
MQINSLGLCRASEKIYEKLEVTGLEDDQHLAVVVSDGCGSPLPCELFDLGNSEYVAVTPDLPIKEASYTLAAVDSCGQVGQTEQHGVDFEAAKWQSRINYRLHKDACAQIRCYDETHPADHSETSLKVMQVTSCPICMKFRIRLRFPGAKPGKLRLVLLRAENLAPVASDYTPMGEAKLPAEGPGVPPDRRITVTVNVPWDAEDLIAYAWEEGQEGLLIQQRLNKSGWDAMRQQLDNLFFNNAGEDPYYDEWFRIHRTTKHTIGLQRKVRFELNPKFSIIVPLYKTPVGFFEEMITSVEAQSYANWECVLVNSTPNDLELKTCIDKATERDRRIKVIELEKNLGISLNTNAGIAEATGDYICFFDHDDLLEPDILFEYAKAINNDRAVDLIYCDEDKIAPDGKHREPSFKPDFNLDLLYNSNYICHMLCVRTSILAQIEPNTKENDGAQDYNTTLQVIERAQRICHIPRMLYHWRISENSTAGPAEAKSYATEAGVLALQSHMDRRGLKAKVTDGKVPFTFDVAYAVPEPTPLVSIIVPTYEHVDLLRACVESIFEKSTYVNFELIIVENNSRKQETFDYYKSLESDPRVKVITWKGLGFNFSELINLGRSHAKGDYLLLLNNDTEVITCDWIERMVGNAARPEIGCVGAKLYYPDDTIQHAGVVFADGAAHSFGGMPRENEAYFRLAVTQRDAIAVTGACLMVSAELFDSVGGFDTELAVAFNDVDFCLKMLSLGKFNVFLPDVELYHYESVSRGFDEDIEGQGRLRVEDSLFKQRFARQFNYRDPYYNPNLIPRRPEACYYHF